MARHAIRLRSPARLSLAIAGLAMVSCSSPSARRFTLHEVLFLRQEDSLIVRGAGCMTFSLPSDGSSVGSGFADGDLEVSEGAQGDAYVVQVKSGQELLASRSYDEAMLASGAVDEFSVTTPQHAVYLLRYWGGGTCSLSVDASIE